MGTMYDLVQGFLDDGRSFGVDWWEEVWTQDHSERYETYAGSVQPLPLPRMHVLDEMMQPTCPDLLHLILSADLMENVNKYGFKLRLRFVEDSWLPKDRESSDFSNIIGMGYSLILSVDKPRERSELRCWNLSRPIRRKGLCTGGHVALLKYFCTYVATIATYLRGPLRRGLTSHNLRNCPGDDTTVITDRPAAFH